MVTSAAAVIAAAEGIVNAPAIATASNASGLPFSVCLALIQMESGGKNIYGHDTGGVFTLPGRQELEVTEANYAEFIRRVMAGETSNGVGPCQITYAGTLRNGRRDGGYFTQMTARGLHPWDPADSCRFGFELIAANYARHGSWATAGAHYNGGTKPGPTALAYGQRFARLVQDWQTRLDSPLGDPVSKFTPPAPPFIAARHQGGKQTPRAIVMHGTVSSDNAGTARNIANWWHGPTSPVTSAHYVVDPRETIQCVGDHAVAYHCGYNTGSIAVELCDEQQGPASRWADADSIAILSRSATLVAQLCLAYGIEIRRPTVAELRAKGPHGIYGHDDSRLAFGRTTHTDPRDFPWTGFIAQVQAAALTLTRITPRLPASDVQEDEMTPAENQQLLADIERIVNTAVKKYVGDVVPVPGNEGDVWASGNDRVWMATALGRLLAQARAITDKLEITTPGK